LAGLAISNSGTILLHLMGYPLTSYFGVPHGLANAVVLEPFLDFMKKHEYEGSKLKKLDIIFEKHKGIKKILNNLKINEMLSEYEIDLIKLEHSYTNTLMHDDIKHTPFKVDINVIRKIYYEALRNSVTI